MSTPQCLALPAPTLEQATRTYWRSSVYALAISFFSAVLVLVALLLGEFDADPNRAATSAFLLIATAGIISWSHLGTARTARQHMAVLKNEDLNTLGHWFVFGRR